MRAPHASCGYLKKLLTFFDLLELFNFFVTFKNFKTQKPKNLKSTGVGRHATKLEQFFADKTDGRWADKHGTNETKRA